MKVSRPLENLAAELLIGSCSLPYPAPYSIQALEHMITRYSDPLSPYESDKIDRCLLYYCPNKSHYITNKDKIDLIIHGLKLEDASLNL